MNNTPTNDSTSQPQSYLDRISFDPKLAQGIVASVITNIRIVMLLVLTILFLGVISYINLPRRLNPEIKIPIITVVTVMPGAAPDDVESLVTIPLENEIKSIAGIDTLTSSSSQNVSVISVQFTSSVSQDKAKDEVISAVESVTDLPEDANTPKVTALDFEDQPIWTFALSSKENDLPSLMRFSEILKEKVEDLTKIDRVTVRGYESQEIVVELSPEKMTQYGVNPLTLSTLVRNNLKSFPAGNAVTSRNTIAITVDPSIVTVNDIRKLHIVSNGKVITLGDIATISERSKPNQQPAYIASNSQEATRVVTFDIYKTSSAKIDEAFKQVETQVDEEIKKANDHYSVHTISNSAEEITTQFQDLVGEFRSTILLVFACLLLFLGLRQAVIATFTVPLTFLSAFFLMQVLGMSINFLSLFAFLLALGLLVDDTIVVVSAMTTYYNTGKFTPKEAALLVWRDTIVPIWSTTITTIWSFIPLLLSSGIIGEFIKPIPVVVTVTMVSSTAIAVLITLPFMMVILGGQIAKRVVVLAKIIAGLIFIGILVSLIKSNPLFPLIALLFVFWFWVISRVRKTVFEQFKNKIFSYRVVVKSTQFLKKITNHGIIDVIPFSNWYFNLISKILHSKSARRKVIIGSVIYSIGAFLLLPFGQVTAEFFPKTDAELFYVSVEQPNGSRSEINNTQILSVANELRDMQYMEFLIIQNGTGLSSMGGSTDSGSSGLITIHLVAQEKRPVTSFEIAESIRKRYKDYSQAKVTVVEQSGGPPAGADVQISLQGEDLATLDALADTVEGYLKTQSGVTNIQKSIKPGTSALTFVPDMNKLAEYNIGVESLGLWLRTYASGFTLDSADLNEISSDEMDIVFRYSTEKPSVESLSRITIPTMNGQNVPLTALGTFKTKSNPTSIAREDGKRSLTVSAAVTQGFSIPEINKGLENFVSKDLDLPDGYNWKTGGVNEENTKSVQSILQAMVVAFILILVTMVVQFRSYRQAIIVLIVIPLAVSSVFVIFALTGTPLSFPAIIGVLSLFGIVVTNSMFIVDKINMNLREKMPFIQALADAGSSRMEPIILTKLCTVFGLLPITLADPLWRGLGGAIISGLLLASTIMLLFIPVLYFEWFAPKELKG